VRWRGKRVAAAGGEECQRKAHLLRKGHLLKREREVLIKGGGNKNRVLLSGSVLISRGFPSRSRQRPNVTKADGESRVDPSGGRV